MEQVNETREAAYELEPQDVISSMPEIVISNIMDRLPLKYAVRTSILSKNWRFKWTLLRQFVIDGHLINYIRAREIWGGFSGKDISKLLLLLKGPITKCVLHMTIYQELDSEGTNLLVEFLSKKGIKELTLSNIHHKLAKRPPSHLFSCLALKHLELSNCIIHPPGSFCGFPNLLSLVLYHVRFENYTCGELINRCPLLEILQIDGHEPGCKVKMAEIERFENLSILSLSLCLLDNTTMIRSSAFFQRMCLHHPKLLKLSLRFKDCKFMEEAGTKKSVSTAFPYLKTLNFYEIDFSSDIMLSCAFGMIFGSPNLQTLSITATYENDVPPTAICTSEVDYSTIGQLQLRTVALAPVRGSENEVWLIKCILACSPLLKKFYIGVKSSDMLHGNHGDRMFVSELLKLQRAYTKVEIDFGWF